METPQTVPALCEAEIHMEDVVFSSFHMLTKHHLPEIENTGCLHQHQALRRPSVNISSLSPFSFCKLFPCISESSIAWWFVLEVILRGLLVLGVEEVG